MGGNSFTIKMGVIHEFGKINNVPSLSELVTKISKTIKNRYVLKLFFRDIKQRYIVAEEKSTKKYFKLPISSVPNILMKKKFPCIICMGIPVTSRFKLVDIGTQEYRKIITTCKLMKIEYVNFIGSGTKPEIVPAKWGNGFNQFIHAEGNQ